MSKVTRFFHIRIGGRRNGGATVLVTGDTEKVGFVEVQVAQCNKLDNYCRKTGRETARLKEAVSVPLRALSRKLSEIETEAWKRQEGFWRKNPDSIPTRDFSFATRYFLPKL